MYESTRQRIAGSLHRHHHDDNDDDDDENEAGGRAVAVHEPHDYRAGALDTLWGPTPTYMDGPEDTQFFLRLPFLPNLLKVCFFTWAGGRVYSAADESLEREDLLPPVECARAYTCGRGLSAALQRQWQERHAWDRFAGSTVTTTANAGGGLRGHRRFFLRGNASASFYSPLCADRAGILCYVGPVASFAEAVDGPGGTAASTTATVAGRGGALFAGVVWCTATTNSTSSPARPASWGIGRPGEPLRTGQDAFAEAQATWLNTAALERLVRARQLSEGGREQLRDLCTRPISSLVVTYEPVEAIRFLMGNSVTATTRVSSSSPLEDNDDNDDDTANGAAESDRLLLRLAAGDAPAHRTVKRRPPRAMSVTRALLSALGIHLWRLGYWRLLVDITTLAAPMVLRSYIRYLHGGHERGGDHNNGRNNTDSSGQDVVNFTANSAVFVASVALGLGSDNSTSSLSSTSRAPHPGLGPGPAPQPFVTDGLQQGLFIVLLFFLVSLVHSVAQQKYYQLCYRCFYACRAALGAAIFEKALSIEAKSLSVPGLHVGRVVNMLTNDVEQLEQLALLFWPTIVAPFQVGFAMYFLYKLVGWCVFAGFGISVLFVPVQIVLTYRVYRCYGDLAKATDARLKATHEFLSGVRAAKFMSWEPVFLAKIEARRATEMRLIKHAQTLWTLLSFSTDVLPNLVTAALFAAYFFTGNTLSPEVIYPTLSLAAIMCVPFRLLPLYASWVSSFAVAMQRMTVFLERPNTGNEDGEDEARESAENSNEEDVNRSGPLSREEWRTCAVEYRDATITAYAAEEPPSQKHTADTDANAQHQQQQQQQQSNAFLNPVDVLSGISLRIPRGKLTVVIGPTGSGKSSLLSCLVGALSVTHGAVVLRENDQDSIASVPERPWVLDASVEDNILFFSPMDRARLTETLEVTQLAADLSTLPDGIATRVGDKGIALSGGQQARLGLARAVYARADKDLYLLDDPLSALDPRVAQLVVEQCLLGVLHDKTRILATHQTHIAQHADFVVVMAEGKVEFQGSYAGYKAYARDSAYKGRRSGFVEFSGAMLPVTQPNSVVDLDALMAENLASPPAMAMTDDSLLQPQQQQQQRCRYGAGVAHSKNSSSSASALRQRGPEDKGEEEEGEEGEDDNERQSYYYSSRGRHSRRRSVHERDGRGEGRGSSSPFLAVATAVESSAAEGFYVNDTLATVGGVLSPTTAAAAAARDELRAASGVSEVGGASGVLLAEASSPSRGGKVIRSLAEEEERARGSVPMGLYARYIRACGGRNAVILFVLVYALSELMMVSSNLWLSYWSDHPASHANRRDGGHDNVTQQAFLSVGHNNSSGSGSGSGSGSDGGRGKHHGPPARLTEEELRVYIYLGCVVIGALGLPLRFVVSLGFLRRGSRVFHENLLLAISRATLSFFDAVPHGRLLNRFSRDVHLIDSQMASVVIAFAMCCVYLTSSLIIMVGSQLLTFFIVVPFVLVFYKITVFNCAAVRTLQRLDNVATTPVVSILGDVLAGRWTITAFRKGSYLLSEALRRVDMKFASSYTIVVAQVWVAVRVQLLSATLLTTVALLGVLSKHVSWIHINLGLISLTITNASAFTAVLSRLMDASSALEASMNSVERVVQYTDQAPQEGGGFFDEAAQEEVRQRRQCDWHRHLQHQHVLGNEEESSSSGSSSSAPTASVVFAAEDGEEERVESGDEERRSGSGDGSSKSYSNNSRGSVKGGRDDASFAGTGCGALAAVRARRGSNSYNSTFTATDGHYTSFEATRNTTTAVTVPSDGGIASRHRNGNSIGSLELRHVSLRYRPGLPLVLQDLSFTVRPGERIGVVGRTGSGKSSLMLILMRLIDTTAGTIYVNGRDVASFRNVERLRRLFAIIPQDPVLFDGSIRSNLDPLYTCTDDEIWQALEHVGMATFIEKGTSISPSASASHSSPCGGPQDARRGKLSTPVAEGGRNLSVGQRQLLCLARALLRRDSCFLLMDEATAGVDGAMDQQIQAVVQHQFPRHTILSIAHRLHTVAQYDRILMLDNGRLACLGTPDELMRAVPTKLGENEEKSRKRSTTAAGQASSCPSLQQEQEQGAPTPFAQLVMSMGPEATRLFTARMKKDTPRA